MLESGQPQQCMCGYSFRIVQVKPEDFDDVQTAAKFKWRHDKYSITPSSDYMAIKTAAFSFLTLLKDDIKNIIAELVH